MAIAQWMTCGKLCWLHSIPLLRTLTESHLSLEHRKLSLVELYRELLLLFILMIGNYYIKCQMATTPQYMFKIALLISAVKGKVFGKK